MFQHISLLNDVHQRTLYLTSSCKLQQLLQTASGSQAPDPD